MTDTNTVSTNAGASSLHRIAPLRGTDNYNVWRVQMEDILTDLDLYAYVMREKPAPARTIEKEEEGPKLEGGKPGPTIKKIEPNPDYPEWAKHDRKALSNVRLRVDGNVLTHIQASETSADAWDLLAATFQVKGTVGLIDLRRKFFSHRMTDSEDIEEHIQKMRGWYQQINDIAPGSCTEADWITTLVSSLPDSWDTFTQSVDFKFDLQDKNRLANQVSDLRSRIMAEAHRRSTRNDSGKTFFSTNKPSVNKFMCTNFNPQKGPDKSKSKCNNCGKIGHWAAECRGPGGGAYKQGNQHRNRGENNKRKHNNSTWKPPNGNARTHIAISEKTPQDYVFSTIENQISLLNSDSDTWIADSGTTTHITKNRNLFTEYRPTDGYVMGVTGNEPIIGRGTISLLCPINARKDKYRKIVLTNVAYVPTSPVNLISLSLVTDKGYAIAMEGKQLEIKNKYGRTIIKGSKLSNQTQGSLWKMDVQTITAKYAESKHAPTIETALIKQTGRTWYEWHKILGHISPAALLKLGMTDLVDRMEIAESVEGLNFECETCIQAKAHVQPFPKESKSKIKEIGELIVTNVWGPARMTSIGRYQYYVSFTNVATRYTHIAFLRHKDKTIDEYKAFETLLNTQLGKKIKHVRFDNGGEFVNKEWIEHMKSKGTILEMTAPYSAQQNGIAEQLNRTLTEKARAMLIKSGAPKHLWSEAITYACYLKNCIPTQVHGKFWKTPFESFWNRKPNISVLWPWGTKCYMLNQGETISKLDPKTFTAIFTGISDSQGKSWRYYKSGANRILHSHNITFMRAAVFAEGKPNNPDWLETVTPPAEGEITSQKDSDAE
ncbi:hypothetical protein OPQ81_005270 [Rhizoctonia solani]|nr:hypothetical protein OPQ81_005270 [Rhizoctonia solani]